MSILKKWKYKLFESEKILVEDLQFYHEIVNQVNQLALHYRDESRDVLRRDLRNMCKVNEPSSEEECLVRAFAIVKVAIERTLEVTPFDVQITGGIALHEGKLIEMQTGEGKTLTAIFPAVFNALQKGHVQILTFNDYLARRDAQWMTTVYNYLGQSCKYVNQGMDWKAKKSAYSAHITYTTAKELGFDYLRSFLAYEVEEQIFPDLHYAIIDEADAILLDEARNPLVLAGDIVTHHIDFHNIAQSVSELQIDIDFLVEEDARITYLTDDGLARMEHASGVTDLVTPENKNLASAINLALEARVFLKRDIDYIVKNREVLLVDEFTG